MAHRERLGPHHSVQALYEVIMGVDNVSHHSVKPVISFLLLWCVWWYGSNEGEGGGGGGDMHIRADRLT